MNAHASGAAYQKLADVKIIQEHTDEVAEMGCGDIKQVHGGNGPERAVGVDSFKYLNRLLHRLGYNWLAVLKKILKTRQVWGW